MQVITFVKNNNFLYPKEDDDYEILRQSKCPTNLLDADYFKTFELFLKQKSIKIEIIDFDTLHKSMLRKLRDAYSLTIIKTNRGIKISGEPLGSKRLDSLSNKLTKWYKLHYYNADTSLRSNKKGFSLSIDLNKIKL
jgi:hypothetical protein